MGLRISPGISPCLGLGVEGLRNIYFERLCDLILHALTVASNLRHDYLKQSPSTRCCAGRCALLLLLLLCRSFHFRDVGFSTFSQMCRWFEKEGVIEIKQRDSSVMLA